MDPFQARTDLRPLATSQPLAEARLEVEGLRLEWLALVGRSRLAQRVSHLQVAAWVAWTRWQAAKERLDALEARQKL